MAQDSSGDDSDGQSGGSNCAPDRTAGGRVTRRRLIASGAATWATASLAGCRYITDPGTGDDGSGDGTDTPTVTTETTTTDEPVATPTATPTDGASTETGDDSGTDTGVATPSPTDSPTPTPTPTDTPTPPPTTTSCSLSEQFAAGMEVGLHVSVYDPETGEPLGSDAVDAVTVEFPNAAYGPLEMNWEGDHEAYAADTWGSKITTDADTEPGTYRYEVTISADDDRVETTVTDRFTVV